MNKPEIKFRVWDRGKKSLSVPPRMSRTFSLFDFAMVHFPSDKDSIPLQFASDCERFVTMQFTGLKDRAGVEIYEGDILELNNDLEFRGAISWDEKFAGWCYDELGLHEVLSVGVEPWVIGNIYQNADLLDGAHGH